MTFPAGFKNGQIPLKDLARVPDSYVDPATLKSAGPQYLEFHALVDFLQMAAMFEKRFKKRLLLTQGYRPLGKKGDKTDATQWGAYYLSQHGGPTAMAPGDSIHGLAQAGDLGSGVEIAGSAEHEWVVKNGPRFGWVWGAAKSEPWHTQHLKVGFVRSLPKLKAGQSTILVQVVKERLTTLGFDKPPMKPTPDYGPGLVTNVAAFKASRKLANRAGDNIGATAWKALAA